MGDSEVDAARVAGDARGAGAARGVRVRPTARGLLMLHNVCAGCCCTRRGCDAARLCVLHVCACKIKGKEEEEELEAETEDRKRRRTELMQGRNEGKDKGKSGKADADRGKGKDDKDFAPPAPCPPWRYWPIALPDRDRAMGVQEVGQGVARIEHAENRVPAPKAKHSTRTQRAAEPARADARSWLTRVNQFNREMSDRQQALSDDSEGTSSWIEAGRDRVSLASVSEGTSFD